MAAHNEILEMLKADAERCPLFLDTDAAGCEQCPLILICMDRREEVGRESS